MATVDPPSMLVAVDIGNSRIKFGRFARGRDLVPPRRLPEPLATLELPLASAEGDFDGAQLAAWCDEQISSSADWLVSSVHRGAADRLAIAVADLAKSRGVDWRFRLLRHCDVPLSIDVDAPERVGMDRLLAAVAADHLREPERAAIVVDLGTAIKVDLVNAAGAFAGGAILPGRAMSARALEEQTDALPRVAVDEWRRPPEPLGKSTVAAIESGLFWGALGAIRELVAQLSAQLPTPPDVFVSGGASEQIAELLSDADCHSVRRVPHLVLAGVALVDRVQIAALKSTMDRADGD